MKITPFGKAFVEPSALESISSSPFHKPRPLLSAAILQFPFSTEHLETMPTFPCRNSYFRSVSIPYVLMSSFTPAIFVFRTAETFQLKPRPAHGYFQQTLSFIWKTTFREFLLWNLEDQWYRGLRYYDEKIFAKCMKTSFSTLYRMSRFH